MYNLQPETIEKIEADALIQEEEERREMLENQLGEQV